ncbi:MAG: penicillin-binding protein 2 [Chloroflexota bacterium]
MLTVFAVAAAVRLADWQVVRGPKLREEALALLQRPADIPTLRGRILDRNGTVLAVTGFRDRLVAYPKLLNVGSPEAVEARRHDVLADLTDILGLTPDEQDQVAQQLADANSEYDVIARQLTEAQSQAIRDELAKTEGRTLYAVGLEPQPVRMYPNPGGQPGTTLASQLLGFVDSNGKGNYGIEQQYDTQLAGIPTHVAAARDPFGRLLGSSATVLKQGVDGVDVRLTIDAGLQLQLERELYAAWATDKAKRVSGMVMDPDTGAILAWGTVPGYDANDYAREWQVRPEVFTDPIASAPYEPGSVMKMFTAAAALDSKTITLSKPVKDTAALHFPPYTIRNADHLAMGLIPFRDVVAYSRNVATARTAFNLGKTTARASSVLYRTWDDLGIGHKTGVDLANEQVGMVVDPARKVWQPVELANRSFGQGVTVTQVQLAAGYAPMINGGMKVTPHFLVAAGDQPRPEDPPQRVLNPQVAGQLHSLLDHVTSAVPWYAAGALIPGYQVGGKTGTAQIWMNDRLQYSVNVFNFSFVGYVGGDKPAAVVAVRIEEAKVTSKVQGQININLSSYQLFRRIAMDVIHTLDVRRSTWPGAGYPEPLSAADAQNTPTRYADHLAQKKKGEDLLSAIHNRYSPGGGSRILTADAPGTGAAGTVAAGEGTGAADGTTATSGAGDGTDGPGTLTDAGKHGDRGKHPASRPAAKGGKAHPGKSGKRAPTPTPEPSATPGD